LQRYIVRNEQRPFTRSREGGERVRTPNCNPRRSPKGRSPRGRRDHQTRRERSNERSPRRCEGTNITVINTISGGFEGCGPSHSAKKRHLRAIKRVNMIRHRTRRSMPDIIFTNQDFKSIDMRQDDSMVIGIEVANYEIRKTW